MTQESEQHRLKQVPFQKYNSSFYFNNKVNSSPPKECRAITWKTKNFIADVEYSWLTQKGASLKECCPPHLADKFQQVTKEITAQLKSFSCCGIPLSDFSLLPDFVFKRYITILNKITAFAWNDKQTSDQEYKILKHALHISSICRGYNLKFDLPLLKSMLHLKNYRQFSKVLSKRSKIDYNIFGTKTGRFSTERGSFPILNLDKKFRKLIIPNNDLFLVLDYNGAEARTLLALNETPQPDYDIHNYNKSIIEDKSLARHEAKQRFFAWLYNPEAQDTEFEKIYDKKIYKKYYDNQRITTPFGREIGVEEKKALNYLIQSTTNDIVIESAIKINDIISSSKSCIAFLVHDSLVIDMHRDDIGILDKLIESMENTRFAKFKCNVSLGKNYGELKDIK
jgi:hypothetical protein